MLAVAHELAQIECLEMYTENTLQHGDCTRQVRSLSFSQDPPQWKSCFRAPISTFRGDQSRAQEQRG